MKKKFGIILFVLTSVLIFGGLLFNKENESKDVYLYLVRHGQTESNVKEMLVGGGGNYDLTKKGIDDAVALGERLKETPFVAVYSSPLGRAHDTAGHILFSAEQDETEIQIIEGLRDIHWGDAEGYTAQEFVEKYKLSEFPDAFGAADDATFVSPINAESKYAFCKRFEEALDNIVKENASTGGNVLVVAHSSMAFWLQQEFPELNLGDLENTTITILRYDGSIWELVMYNNQPL